MKYDITQHIKTKYVCMHVYIYTCTVLTIAMNDMYHHDTLYGKAPIHVNALDDGYTHRDTQKQTHRHRHRHTQTHTHTHFL